jgi:hypothetical protein
VGGKNTCRGELAAGVRALEFIVRGVWKMEGIVRRPAEAAARKRSGAEALDDSSELLQDRLRSFLAQTHESLSLDRLFFRLPLDTIEGIDEPRTMFVSCGAS